MNDKIWKPILDFEDYIISNFGEIKNKHNQILKPRKDKDGYLRIKLFHNTIPKRNGVHTLVLNTFLYHKLLGLTCNHKDGNKLNNFINNLEWVTQSNNNKHAYRTGLKNHKGENHPKCKHTFKDILTIRKLFQKGLTQTEIAIKYHTTQPRIHEIVYYKTWNYKTKKELK